MKKPNIKNLALIIFAVIIIIATIINYNYEQPQSHNIVDIGDIKIKDFDNNETSIANLDNQLFIINVTASWCPYCLREHEYILKLKESFPAINIYAVTYRDQKADMFAWLTKEGDPYSHIYSDNDLKNKFGLQSIPATLVVLNGKIIFRINHSLDSKLLNDELIPFLNSYKNSV